jgi:hypothetical protein
MYSVIRKYMQSLLCVELSAEQVGAPFDQHIATEQNSPTFSRGAEKF